MGCGSHDHRDWEILLPTTCKLGGPGKPVVESQSSSKGPRTRSPNVPGQEKTEVSAQVGKEWIHPSSIFLFHGALWEFDDAYPHWGGSSALFSSPVQMLISSRTPLQTHSEIILNLGTSWSVKLTQNNHDQSTPFQFVPQCISLNHI